MNEFETRNCVLVLDKLTFDLEYLKSNELFWNLNEDEMKLKKPRNKKNEHEFNEIEVASLYACVG